MFKKVFFYSIIASFLLASGAAAQMAIPTLYSSTDEIAPGSLIQAEGSTAVYYLASDNKRYVFPNEKTYNTWYADFSEVQVITLEQLQTYMIGGNVTYRPGTRLVKITTDPKTYAVEPGGVLRWITSESVWCCHLPSLRLLSTTSQRHSIRRLRDQGCLVTALLFNLFR